MPRHKLPTEHRRVPASLTLPPKLLKKARAAVNKRGISLSKKVEELLEVWIGTNP